MNSLRVGVPSAALGKKKRPVEDALTVQLSMCSTAKFRAKIPLPLTAARMALHLYVSENDRDSGAVNSHGISASAWRGGCGMDAFAGNGYRLSDVHRAIASGIQGHDFATCSDGIMPTLKVAAWRRARAVVGVRPRAGYKRSCRLRLRGHGRKQEQKDEGKTRSGFV